MVFDSSGTELSGPERDVLIALGKQGTGSIEQIREWTKYADSSFRSYIRALRKKGMALNPVAGLWKLSEKGEALFQLLMRKT